MRQITTLLYSAGFCLLCAYTTLCGLSMYLKSSSLSAVARLFLCPSETSTLIFHSTCPVNVVQRRYDEPKTAFLASGMDGQLTGVAGSCTNCIFLCAFLYYSP